jgi:hypothetical protein
MNRKRFLRIHIIYFFEPKAYNVKPQNEHLHFEHYAVGKMKFQEHLKILLLRHAGYLQVQRNAKAIDPASERRYAHYQ